MVGQIVVDRSGVSQVRAYDYRVRKLRRMTIMSPVQHRE
jgi:hypothetical protein